jgi:hypothetical protein
MTTVDVSKQIWFTYPASYMSCHRYRKQTAVTPRVAFMISKKTTNRRERRITTSR